MAFNSEHLGVIAQPIGGNGIRIVSYRTDDAQDVVTSASYFTNATSFGLRESDVIFVSRLFGEAGPYIVIIETIDDAGDGTAIVSDMERYGIEYRASYLEAEADYHPLFAPAFIKTAGYSVPGDDGGALYKWVASEPAHGGKLSISLAFSGDTEWYELTEPVVRPEMFGAGKVKTTLSTDALLRMVTYVNATSAPIWLSAIYRSDEPLDFTCDGLIIEGTTAHTSGFVFDGSDGIRLDQTAIDSVMTRFRLSNFCLLTTGRMLYKGFYYTTKDSTGGGATMREIHGLQLSGESSFDLDGELLGQPIELRDAGWLAGFDLNNCDNAHIDYCRIFGSWQSWQNNNPVSNPKFPVETFGIKITNSTYICINDVQMMFFRHGFFVTGQGEGCKLTDCAATACWNGFTASALVGPSNQITLERNHFSGYNWGVNIGEDSGGTMMHVLRDNLIFMFPGNNYSTGYRHIVFNGLRSTVRNNHLYVHSTDDPSVRVDVGMDILNSNNLIIGNTFQRFDVAIRTSSGAGSNVISTNYTVASVNVLTVAPLVDNGPGTTCYLNEGDKRPLWPATLYSNTGEITIHSAGNAVSIYGGSAVSPYLKLQLPNVSGSPVNYFDMISAIAGSAPQIRARGSDTDIDVRFTPAGAGLVRFGTRTASSDAAVTGYIEIKDAAGTVRKLAVID